VLQKSEGSDVYFRKQDKIKLETVISTENPSLTTVKSKSIFELFLERESTFLEFKSTLRYALKVPVEIIELEKQLNEKQGDERTRLHQIIFQKRKELQKSLESAVVDSIAAFLNTEGGIMIVGYDDDNKKMVGLEKDFASLKDRKDWDGWLQYLINLITTTMGTSCIDLIRIEPITLESSTLARIIVNASPSPVYSKEDNETILHVRFLNVTRKLRGKDMVDYIRHHWKNIP
jgi:hypothetical protein